MICNIIAIWYWVIKFPKFKANIVKLFKTNKFNLGA